MGQLTSARDIFLWIPRMVKSHTWGGNCPEDKTNSRHVVKPKSHALLGFGRLVWYQTQFCLECNGPNTGVLHHVLHHPSVSVAYSFQGLVIIDETRCSRNGLTSSSHHLFYTWHTTVNWQKQQQKGPTLLQCSNWLIELPEKASNITFWQKPLFSFFLFRLNPFHCYCFLFI